MRGPHRRRRLPLRARAGPLRQCVLPELQRQLDARPRGQLLVLGDRRRVRRQPSVDGEQLSAELLQAPRVRRRPGLRRLLRALRVPAQPRPGWRLHRAGAAGRVQRRRRRGMASACRAVGVLAVVPPARPSLHLAHRHPAAHSLVAAPRPAEAVPRAGPLLRQSRPLPPVRGVPLEGADSLGAAPPLVPPLSPPPLPPPSASHRVGAATRRGEHAAAGEGLSEARPGRVRDVSRRRGSGGRRRPP